MKYKCNVCAYVNDKEAFIKVTEAENPKFKNIDGYPTPQCPICKSFDTQQTDRMAENSGEDEYADIVSFLLRRRKDLVEQSKTSKGDLLYSLYGAISEIDLMRRKLTKNWKNCDHQWELSKTLPPKLSFYEKHTKGEGWVLTVVADCKVCGDNIHKIYLHAFPERGKK